MKISEITFPVYCNDDLTRRIIFGTSEPYKNKVRYMLRKATTRDEFYDLLLDDDMIKQSHNYGILIKNLRPNRAWHYVREIFGDKCIKTSSDAGGLKIGNDDFNIIIPNYHGDGMTRFTVFDNADEKCNKLHGIMDYFTSVNGTINIYDYDCGGDIIKTIHGRYGIYIYDGLIAFEKWNDIE